MPGAGGMSMKRPAWWDIPIALREACRPHCRRCLPDVLAESQPRYGSSDQQSCQALADPQSVGPFQPFV